MDSILDKINKSIDDSKDKMIELQSILTSHQALAPESEGDGELEKCNALEKWIRDQGINDIQRIDAKDSRVKSGIRPNLIVTIPGKNTKKNLWIIAHLDVVPVGDLNLWNTDPWKVTQSEGKLFGRGVEDNQQGLVSGLFAGLSLIKNKIIPENTVKLLFIADEEVGSAFGIQYLVDNYSLFSKEDLIIIPDGGDSKGETIEIAEKNLLWMKVTVLGKQAHGSRPDEGINASLAGCDLAVRLHNLQKNFNKKDDLFEPSFSTFEPTKKENNVPNINTIPGSDVFYMDCRIIPYYSLAEIKKEIQRVICSVENEYGVKISYTTPQQVESPATDKNAEVVKILSQAIREVKQTEPRLIGIGGGTVGAYLRQKNYQCAVWSTLDETAHQPNEYCIINNMLDDAKVLAYVMKGNI